MSIAQIGEAGYERIANDEYRTPAWVTEHLLAHVKFSGLVWECAAGQGDMVAPLRAAGLEVCASDIAGYDGRHLDFLSIKTTPLAQGLVRDGLAAIISNPPYSHAGAFIERALAITEKNRGKVAFLLGHDYDTAITTRGHLFRHPAFYGKLMLPRRIRWVGFEDKASPRQIHAWTLWDWSKDPAARPVIIYP
jgi:hypothetical protein